MENQSDSSIFVLFVLSIAQLFGLSLWFVTNAVIDQLIIELQISEENLSVLSIVVTLGFVIGGLFSAISNISDVIDPRKVFLSSTVFGGISTLMVNFTSEFNLILVFRFFTGFFLAGIYPVGMKMTASHFKYQRGLAIGILLSALTIGSGLPYIFLIFGQPYWKNVIYVVVLLAILGGVLVFNLVPQGPFIPRSSEFSINAVKTIFSQKSVLYATLGYLGHMWELYAFWVWFPRMLKEAYEINTNLSEIKIIQLYALGSFLIFFAGGIANIVGGGIADHIGRTKFNIIALSVSGTSALTIGFFFDQPNILLLVGIIWGIFIIPDSPQYSTMITEVCDQSLIGSALAIQTAVGFLLTIMTISLVPVMVDLIGWKFGLMFLSIGPALGIISMILLRRQPDANLIALGKM